MLFVLLLKLVYLIFNLIIMDNRICSARAYMCLQRSSRSRFGSPGSVPIDQTPAQPFNIDPATGRPMSDIQRLVHLQDNYALQTQFSQLKEFKQNFLPDDVSNEDALRYMVPRYSQLPSELLEHKDKLLRHHLKKVEEDNARKSFEESQKLENEFYEKVRKDLEVEPKKD